MAVGPSMNHSTKRMEDGRLRHGKRHVEEGKEAPVLGGSLRGGLRWEEAWTGATNVREDLFALPVPYYEVVF